MENLGLEVRHSAQASAHARDQANSAASVAAQGGQAVDSVVQTMAEITASARRIGDITGTIDAIAFQTNILALNAAVEAARAGSRAGALPWWRAKCRCWPSAVPRRPSRSSS
jgi:methyl-accepting chemotaxis protein